MGFGLSTIYIFFKHSQYIYFCFPLLIDYSTAPRHLLPKHFTASAVVIAQGHVLLVHHKRIGAWLPPGGHIEEFELPHETAIRETLEETAIEIEVLSEPLPDTQDADAFFLHAPLCLHAVKATENGKTIYHLDLAYLCRPLLKNDSQVLELPPITVSNEVNDARWVSIANLDAFTLAKNVSEALHLAIGRLATTV